MQVNVVATEQRPVGGTNDIGKQVDSFGDNRNPSEVLGNSAFLTINVQENGRVYTNQDAQASSTGEPTDYDVYNGNGDSRPDLKNWRIEIRHTV